MAAGPALEMWSKQSGTATSPDGRQRIVTMTRAFTVTLAYTDPLEIVYQSAGLPLVGDLYPGTFIVICKTLKPQRISPILAVVTVEYEGEVGPGDSTTNPTDIEYNIEWSCTTTDEEIDEDWNGKPLVTKNFEPIYGITEKLSDDVVTIERNFLTINRYALRAYRRATNSDTFLDWPPGTARLIDDSQRAVFHNGVIKYWKVRAVIQFREPFRTTPDKAWYKRVRHEGLWVRDTAGGPVRHGWDDTTKHPTSKPIQLKEDGTAYPKDSDEAFWLEFQTLGSLPFNALGLV
jgi:hypothetical protein